MKRKNLIRYLQQHGCCLVREGSNHSVWMNSKTGAKEAVPRHPEVGKFLAQKICKRLTGRTPSSTA